MKFTKKNELLNIIKKLQFFKISVYQFIYYFTLNILKNNESKKMNNFTSYIKDIFGCLNETGKGLPNYFTNLKTSFKKITNINSIAVKHYTYQYLIDEYLKN